MNLKKRLVTLSVMLLLSNFLSYPITVYASTIKDETVLDEYLNFERDKDTGHIDEKVEKELNRQGVFDDEIALLDNTAIESLNKAQVIEVVTEYLDIDENGEAEKMTSSEIDDFIEANYSDELKKYRNDNEGFIEKALKAIGLVPREVNAANQSNFSDSKCFKKTIIITQQTKGSNWAHVVVYFTWLSEPEVRNTDVAFVYFADADLMDSPNISCKYYYWENGRVFYQDNMLTINRVVDEQKYVDYTKEMKNNLLESKDDFGTFVQVDLLPDVYNTGRQYADIKRTNHYIVMQMDVKKNETDVDGAFLAQVKYYHMQLGLDLEVGVSIDTSGNIGFSAVFNTKTYMHAMGEPIRCTYRWK